MTEQLISLKDNDFEFQALMICIICIEVFLSKSTWSQTNWASTEVDPAWARNKDQNHQ